MLSCSVRIVHVFDLLSERFAGIAPADRSPICLTVKYTVLPVRLIGVQSANVKVTGRLMCHYLAVVSEVCLKPFRIPKKIKTTEVYLAMTDRSRNY